VEHLRRAECDVAEKKKVLRWCLKVDREILNVLISSGSEFQVVGQASANVRPPTCRGLIDTGVVQFATTPAASRRCRPPGTLDKG